jgi:formate hydrogenlyase transcriptional activator
MKIGSTTNEDGRLIIGRLTDELMRMQTRLAAQEREVERIGGKTTIKVNVRVIVATNRDLDKEMIDGRFRNDLYYRLNIFPIQLPPLRERKEDIPALAAHFIRQYAKKMQKRRARASRP